MEERHCPIGYHSCEEVKSLVLQVDGLTKIITRLRHHVSTDNICDCPAHMEGQPHRGGCLLMAVAEVTGEVPTSQNRNHLSQTGKCSEPGCHCT